MGGRMEFVLPARLEMEDLTSLRCGWSGTKLEKTLHPRKLKNNNEIFTVFEHGKENNFNQLVMILKPTFDIFIHIFDYAG